MPFTDEQFKKFMEVLDMRELLIRIDENTKNAHNAFIEHSNKDTAEFAIVKKSTEKLHERLDDFKEAVQEDIEKSVNFQNRLIGAFGVATIAMPIIIAIFFRRT